MGAFFAHNVLKALHEKTRKIFVESPGFGIEREMRRPDEYYLDLPEETYPPRQPGYPATLGTFAGETALRPVEPKEDDYRYHLGLFMEFVNPRGFGYVKNRKNVAGFQSHGFTSSRALADPSEKWKIDNILLIGFLIHEKPVVYLSDTLPSMKLARCDYTAARFLRRKGTHRPQGW